jgi:hypothetical protein
MKKLILAAVAVLTLAVAASALAGEIIITPDEAPAYEQPADATVEPDEPAAANEESAIADEVDKQELVCRAVSLTIPAYDRHLTKVGHPGANIDVTVQRLRGAMAPELVACNPRNELVADYAQNGRPRYAVLKVGYQAEVGAYFRLPKGEKFRVSFRSDEVGIPTVADFLEPGQEHLELVTVVK